jgi:hypothetical protein
MNAALASRFAITCSVECENARRMGEHRQKHWKKRQNRAIERVGSA